MRSETQPDTTVLEHDSHFCHHEKGAGQVRPQVKTTEGVSHTRVVIMPTHSRATTTDRGYGNQHQQERERLRPHVERGETHCTEPICLMPDRWIEPGTPWDLAHDRANPGCYHGPAHAKCNRAEGARHGNAKRANNNNNEAASLWWNP